MLCPIAFLLWKSSINQSINQSIIYLHSKWISNVKSNWTAWQQGRNCAYSCHIKIQKILKYYYKKITEIKYSRRANNYSHCASTSILSSMASREFLKRWREPKSVLSTGSLFQMLTTLSQKKCDQTEQLLKRLYILNWWPPGSASRYIKKSCLLIKRQKTCKETCWQKDRRWAVMSVCLCRCDQ